MKALKAMGNTVFFILVLLVVPAIGVWWAVVKLPHDDWSQWEIGLTAYLVGAALLLLGGFVAVLALLRLGKRH